LNGFPYRGRRRHWFRKLIAAAMSGFDLYSIFWNICSSIQVFWAHETRDQSLDWVAEFSMNNIASLKPEHM
jgi:hypothetical protein